MRLHRIALIIEEGKVIARGSMKEMIDALKDIRINHPYAYIEERIW